MPAPFIRVKDKSTKHEFSIREDQFNAEAQTKLDKPALGPDGEVIPPKHYTSVAQSASEKKAGSAATSEKENS